jgi:hypothetical protein
MSRIEALDNTTSYLRWIILAMMKREGRNFTQCELCTVRIPKGHHEIHHTKYEGATYYDLRIVCRSCNKLPTNMNLE